jgi:ATP-dependent DNA ligase
MSDTATTDHLRQKSGFLSLAETAALAARGVTVFDPHEGAEDLRALALVERKARLETSLLARKASKAARIRFIEHFETGGDAVPRSACQLSLEGVVSKRAGAYGRSGQTASWTKAKCRAGHEVVIGGIENAANRRYRWLRFPLIVPGSSSWCCGSTL